MFAYRWNQNLRIAPQNEVEMQWMEEAMGLKKAGHTAILTRANYPGSSLAYFEVKRMADRKRRRT